ncbi:exopolysaccharide biosynthesis polyprenyl glycosylphosphotransferase [Candidatus Pelagibacter sp.]|nr:exopolysaccharide biosynthesis polyprenyl glycosylphosphotransferase [Candidatus Pelagibacter sp.]
MFRLEKIFQQNDILFLNILIFFKSFIVYISIYIFSILEFNSIYDLSKFDIYIKSKYFLFSFCSTLFYFLSSLIFNVKQNKYKISFFNFLLNDITPVFIGILISWLVFFIFRINFNININLINALILIFINLFLFKVLSNFIYNKLLDENIIQRNILLVGSIKDIKKILSEKKDKINIYKCCFIRYYNDKDLSDARKEIKIPIFTQNADVRSILEYHALGQVWILDSDDSDLINYYLKYIIKFSVDILIIKVKNNPKLKSNNLINQKYEFENYEISKFHGSSLFIKIILDKILSIFFLLLLSPAIILSMILIYIEDGFPIFFTQDRTGWDGRRFKIFKLRSLKKHKFDKTVQVIEDDKRFLKIGKIIRRLSIDEVPQFFNVLNGDMSIVGPRPHMVEHDIKYSKLFQSFLKRHKTSPGLTGWAQVSGHRGATPTPEHMKKRMDADLWYMNNWTIWLDLFIILKTFYIIFAKPGK